MCIVCLLQNLFLETYLLCQHLNNQSARKESVKTGVGSVTNTYVVLLKKWYNVIIVINGIITFVLA